MCASLDVSSPCSNPPNSSHTSAVDMSDPTSIVSPGGVGFDINCGVRLLRTNLTEEDVAPVKEQLAQALFDHIPVGVGSKGIIPTDTKNLEAALVRPQCFVCLVSFFFFPFLAFPANVGCSRTAVPGLGPFRGLCFGAKE